VGLESGGTGEHDGADVALDVGVGSVVNPFVGRQSRLDRELLATLVARKRLLACQEGEQGH